MRSVCLVLWFLILFCAPALAQVQSDFDGDTISDRVTVNSSYVWTVNSSVDGSKLLETTLGMAGDLPVMAHWRGLAAPDLCVVRSSGGTLTWRLAKDEYTRTVITFGRSDDIILSGADLTGDGSADPVVMRPKGDRLLWIVKPGMFSDSPGTKRNILFGPSTIELRVFFINPDGLRDRLAFIARRGRRARAVLYDFKTKERRSYRRLPAALVKGSRPRPFPVVQPDGTDALGFVVPDQTETTVYVYSLSGEQIAKEAFSGLGRTFVGDYLAEAPGEEIGLQTSAQIMLFNPFAGTYTRQTAINGNVVNEITVGQVTPASFPTIAPTLAPTATATATPTPTPTPA